MKEALLIMVFGSMGSLCRWGVGRWSKDFMGDKLPFGTLIVNVVGCLLLGFATVAILDNTRIPRPLQTAITIGFLGAFTTFSTFGYETFTFMRDGQWLHAAGNATANFVLGLAAVAAGVYAAKAIVVG